MPELPEVEVVKKSLKDNICNLSFSKVIINTNKLRYTINKNLHDTIKNKKILSVERRSKYILINLDKNLTLLAHLGMTGKFFLVNKKKQKQKTSFYYEITKKDEKHNQGSISFTVEALSFGVRLLDGLSSRARTVEKE